MNNLKDLNNSKTPAADRFLRQRGLVSTESLSKTAVTIIGVGAIGRQVALQLAALGVMKIQLIDFDDVEPHNVTNQGYRMSEVGQAKVSATTTAIAEVDPAIESIQSLTGFEFGNQSTMWYFAVLIRSPAAVSFGNT